VRIRLSDKSYADAVAIAKVGGKVKMHRQLCSLASDFACNDIVYAVCEKDGELVGWCAGFIRETFFAHLPRIVVKKEYRESNVAKEMVDFLIDKLSAQGIVRAYVYVQECDDEDQDEEDEEDPHSLRVRKIASDCGFKTLDIEKHGEHSHYTMCRDMAPDDIIFHKMVLSNRNNKLRQMVERLGG
jgi:hypothetical protein